MVYSKLYPKFEFLPTSQKLPKLRGNFPNFHGKGRNTYLPGRMPFLSRSLIVPCCSLVSVIIFCRQSTFERTSSTIVYFLLELQVQFFWSTFTST